MARDQLEHRTAIPAAPTAAGRTSAEGARAATKGTNAGKLSLLLRGLRHPGMVWPVLRAKWALRRCDHVGPRARLFGRVFVQNLGHITIGERLLMFGGAVRCELVTNPGGVIAIGDRVFINSGVSISAHQLVKIGNRCQIGNYSLLMDNDYHQVGDLSQPGVTKPIILEDDVWLGARVIVLKGVTIGQGAVIGAGSVVTRDIPPRSVAVGAPARVVKTY